MAGETEVTPTEPLKAAAKPLGLVAAAILVFMMLYTTVTVVMREVFDTPVLGVVEVMELALVGLIFVSMPVVFLRDDNIAVDVIDQVVPRWVRNVLRTLGLLLAFGWLAVMMIRMYPLFYDKWEFAEVTMTLSISRWIHWVIIMVGFALSVAAAAWVLTHYLRFGFPRDVTIDGGAVTKANAGNSRSETS